MTLWPDPQGVTASGDICTVYLFPVVAGSSAATGQGQARLGGRLQEGPPTPEASPARFSGGGGGGDGPADRGHVGVGVSGLHRPPAEPRCPGESRREDESREPLPREQPRTAAEAVGGRQTTESGHGRCGMQPGWVCLYFLQMEI